MAPLACLVKKLISNTACAQIQHLQIGSRSTREHILGNKCCEQSLVTVELVFPKWHLHVREEEEIVDGPECVA